MTCRGMGMRRGLGAVTVAVALSAAACGGTSDPEAADGNGNGGDGAGALGRVDADACRYEALESAAEDGPVGITFWHVMTDHNEEVLASLVDDFHASQDLVEVNLVRNNGYSEQQENYRAGMTTGDLPDLVQHQEVFVQQMLDTETALPVEACMEAQDYDLDDYLPRTVEFYAVDGVQWSLPFNVNTPIMYYNRAVFEAAGLDPDDPPRTLEELHDTAQALVDAAAEPDADDALADLTHGVGLKRDGWLLEQFRALQGLGMYDQGNGRSDRVTATAFDDEASLGILTALNDLMADGLAATNPTEGPNNIDNLTGLGSGSHAITFDSSGTMGAAEAILANQYPGVDPGVAPLPGRSEDGGALLGGGSLYISAEDSALAAAAWELATFLTSPEAQATLAVETGFVPVRTSSLEIDELQQHWDESPNFRVAYDQLLEGPENEATAGPVFGDHRAYRELAEETFRRMAEGDVSPEDALAGLVEDTDGLIETYNERIDI